MNRKTLISAIATGITLASITAATASPATSLGDCYNFVISSCNETAHPVSCSNKGMDDCDDVHSSKVVIGKNKKFKANGSNPAPVSLLLPAVQAAR